VIQASHSANDSKIEPKMNEEDILAALEESVEYSGGFVSSYTLPMATGDGGAGKPLSRRVLVAVYDSPGA
jgi:hypothetical protein